MVPLKTILLAALITTATVDAKQRKHGKPANESKWGGNYDFVVIGGGTAGAVIAARLAEVPTWRVLVLEAGGNPPLLSRIPATAPMMQLTESSWRYWSEPQTGVFKGLNHNRMLWSSGKSLGGTSAINYMVYSRGNSEDFDNWEKLGNRGWSYRKVLPYFLKTERENLEYFEHQYHNVSGPMSVEYSYYGEGCASFMKAAKELGYNATDYNGRNQIGVSAIQAVLEKGARQTTFDLFLVKPRDNLEVVPGALVTKIGFDKTGKKAKSVKFVKDGKKYRVSASKETILSAGTFNTPQILLLSGVGPKDHLKDLGIEVVKDLPVGESLGDHVVYPALNFITTTNRTHFDIMKSYIVDLPFWYWTGKGTSTSLGGLEAVGYVKLPNSPQNRPDIELLFHDAILSPVTKKIANIKDETYTKLYNGTEKLIEWSIYPVLLHPKSRGVVKLRSKNISEPPLLHPNFFSDPSDIKTMIEGIRFVLKLLETQEFKKLKTRLNPNPVPGCETLPPNSDAYWECALRTLASTAHDQFGTCKMGPTEDLKAVVDPNLKLRGTNNVRVVDASVIPDTVSGHLFAATVMVAEKAADLVKGDHK